MILRFPGRKHAPRAPLSWSLDGRLTGVTRAFRARAGGLALRGQCLMVDGLALGVLPGLGEALRGRSPLVGLVHHPLALETGLSPARARALRDSERVALSAARVVVATSRTTAEMLVADYAVAASRLVVAPPGTDPAPFSAVSATTPIRLLSAIRNS